VFKTRTFTLRWTKSFNVVSAQHSTCCLQIAFELLCSVFRYYKNVFHLSTFSVACLKTCIVVELYTVLICTKYHWFDLIIYTWGNGHLQNVQIEMYCLDQIWLSDWNSIVNGVLSSLYLQHAVPDTALSLVEGSQSNHFGKVVTSWDLYSICFTFSCFLSCEFQSFTNVVTVLSEIRFFIFMKKPFWESVFK
jgi:hypothetical protein